LEEKIARGKTTIECDQSDKDVNVRELLEGVYVESKSGYFKEILKYSPSENRDTIYHIDNSITISDGKQNTIVQGSRNVGPTRNINSHLDEKLERMLINLYETQKRDMEALAQEIVDYFSERMDKLNPETKADFEAAKNGEWRMKFKLAVPLIKYLGINFETEREIKADEVISGIRKMLHGKEEEVISILNAEPAREKKFLT